ncbi:MAG: hypothetical protein AAB368_05740, partial [bacterium]
MHATTVGAYGSWLDRMLPRGPARLSLRRRDAPGLAAWRRRARARVERLIAPPDSGPAPRPRVRRAYEWDGLHVEHLRWANPGGPATEAILLKPAGARVRLPAVLALHCHGGNKMLGWRKVARGREPVSPFVRRHVEQYYGSAFWANDLARHGYVVLAHDVFAFASRRVRTRDVLPRVRGDAPVADPRTAEELWRYNQWAGGHEHVMAKALFAAGTTWPGVVLAEDRRALDILCARPDVDPRRVGCGGLSGGGLRTVYLAGLDSRVRCAVCVGYMTTWRDMVLNQCWTNTWMVNAARLPRELDF